jgi:regulator of CtrA degradation
MAMFGHPSFEDNTVSFAERLARSQNFDRLFQEGMSLVEEAAAYLDGVGRGESRALPRQAALTYATESMRLTTRLMQLASWLLLQRAVNQGEMSRAQAATDKHKVKLSRQGASAAGEAFDALPSRLQELIGQSLRLQERVIRLDALLYGEDPVVARLPAATPVERQLQELRRAFSN